MSQFCLIVCNGEQPSRALFEEQSKKSDLWIAADGGLKVFLSNDQTPDILVGDLDSAKIPDNPTFDIIKVEDQENNDFEKALMAGRDRGFSNFTVLGATGRRLDQTLKNLSVMMKYTEKGCFIRFIDDYFESTLIPKTIEMDSWKGQVISLFPLSGKVSGISTEGLLYPLNNEVLENGLRDGSSNEAVSTQIKITHTSGSLLLMKQWKADELD